MSREIRLTESQLIQLIKKTVNDILNEQTDAIAPFDPKSKITSNDIVSFRNKWMKVNSDKSSKMGYGEVQGSDVNTVKRDAEKMARGYIAKKFGASILDERFKKVAEKMSQKGNQFMYAVVMESISSGGLRYPTGSLNEQPSDDDDYEERSFGVGEYEDFRNFIEGCNERWCLNVKEWFDRYAEIGPIKVRKKDENMDNQDDGDEHSEILDYKALQRMRDKFKK